MTSGILTGRKVALIFVAFFGTVTAVNLTMATLASGTFGGTVVDNSYVASQKYNDWLSEAREGEALGWNITAQRHAETLMLRISKGGTPIAADVTEALARPPVGAVAGHSLDFRQTATGTFVATLPPGRWQVRAKLAYAGDTRRVQFDIR